MIGEPDGPAVPPRRPEDQIPLIVTAAVENDLIHLTLAGTLDLDARHPVRDTVREQLAATVGHGFVISLAAVTTIDTHGLGVLLAARRQILATGRTFRVRAAGPAVERFCGPPAMALLTGAATIADITSVADTVNWPEN